MKLYSAVILCCVAVTAHADLTNGLLVYYTFNGNANDACGNGYQATIAGATLTEDRFGTPASAYSFNGIDNYITAVITNLPVGSAPRTMTAWVKPMKATAADGLLSFVGYGSGNWHSHFSLGIDPQQDLLLWTGYADPGGETPLPTNVWSFVAASYSNQVVSLSVNGSCTHYAVELNTANNGKLFLGVTSLDGNQPSVPAGSWDKWFTGSIDDLRIYDRALTDDELEKLYAVESGIPDLSIETAAVRLRWVGVSNVAYQVQFSLDLLSWSNLTTVVGAGVETNFVDWVDGMRRFYRLSIAP